MDMVVIVPDVNDENNWSFMENTITLTLTGISQRRRQWWFRRRLSTLTGGMVWWADSRHSDKEVPRRLLFTFAGGMVLKGPFQYNKRAT